MSFLSHHQTIYMSFFAKTRRHFNTKVCLGCFHDLHFSQPSINLFLFYSMSLENTMVLRDLQESNKAFLSLKTCKYNRFRPK